MAIAVLSETELAAKLLTIKTTGDVADILADMPDQVWLPLGGKANNHPLVNALSDSGDALVERVTNGMDALIEREVLRSKRTDFKSPREAADKLFGIPGGHVVGLTDNDRRRELAGALIVTARESGVEREPTVIVEDQGVGQHPSDFDKTLVSLNEENKRSSLYLMGAYGWGGAASVSFCKYAVFVSRRQDDLRRPGQDDAVGWTVVRYNELAEDLFAKHGFYEYLSVTRPGGVRIPTLSPAA